MKVITTNLLNRFWKNGIKPIKDALAGKLDTSRIVNSLLTTEAGFALDARQGKELKDQVDELNSNFDCGTATTNTVQNGVKKVNIGFNKIFETPPIVTFSYKTSQLSTDCLAIDNVTTTGVTIGIYTTSSNHGVTIYWQAMKV